MVATTSPTPSLPWGERWVSVGKGEKKESRRERKRKEGYRRVRRERRMEEEGGKEGSRRV